VVEEQAYEVAIEGPLPDRLRGLLEQVSQARRTTDQPPASLARLRRRAEEDRPRLLRALRSRGYYAAEVSVRIDEDAEPIAVLFDVQPGPVYRLREVEIELTAPAPELELPSLRALRLEPGTKAEAQRILDAETELLRRVRAQGFALAETGERTAVVDHDDDAMDLTLRVRLGPRTRFGAVRFEGLESVEEDFVRGRLDWEAGELITPQRLAQGREDLRATGLFARVQIDLAEEPDDQGRLPVTVEVAERKHRSIAVGVRFRTDEGGPGGSVGWEHRNSFGAGETTELELDASGLGFKLAGDFRKPDVLRRDQALLVGTELARETTDAFDSLSVRSSIGLERVLAPGMTADAGVALRAVEFEDDDEGMFGLVSLPLGFRWDRSDDLLDPTRGGRLNVTNEPFTNAFGDALAFNKTRLGYTQYLKVLNEPRMVLAARGVLGTMFGAERDVIPTDERFFAGGGGSVRGFGFQLAGELDDNNDPLGGRSLLELSGEIRMRFTETIGAVAFVDAGSAFESTVPDFDQELRVGVGPGLRYFSPIGPVRLDVGFPLNRRDADDAFQLYISLGQAF